MNNYQDEKLYKHIGLITDVKFDAEKQDSVTLKLSILFGNTIEECSYCLSDIFTRGRAKFQDFCERFEAIDKDLHLRFESISGIYCQVDVNQYREIKNLSLISNDEYTTDELDEIFDSCEVYEISVPQKIKDFFIFSSTSKRYLSDFYYCGYVTDYKIYKDRENPNDTTIRLKVNVINNYRIACFDFYINQINTTNSEYFHWLCDTFGLCYINQNNKYLPNSLDNTLCDIIRKVCYVKLRYVSISETFYVDEIIPLAEAADEKIYKQFKMLMDSYEEYSKKHKFYESFFFE